MSINLSLTIIVLFTCLTSFTVSADLYPAPAAINVPAIPPAINSNNAINTIFTSANTNSIVDSNKKANSHINSNNVNADYPPYDNSHQNLLKIFLTRDFKGGISYYGVVSIGTPDKRFKLVFDTDAPETWVRYKQMFSFRDGYTKDESKTATKLDKGHFDVYFKSSAYKLTGSKYKDILRLYHGSYDGIRNMSYIAEISQEFFGAKEIQDQASSRQIYVPGSEVGVISLAPAPTSSLGLKMFLRSFKDSQSMKGIVVQPVFSLWFNPVKLSTIGGQLTLGGGDQSKRASQILFHKVTSNIRWQLVMNGFKVNNQVVGCKSSCNAVLDSGIQFIYVPRTEIEEIYDKLGLRFQGPSKLTFIDCNRSLPDIDVVIDNVPYKIYDKHYVNERIVDGKATGECYIGIKATKNTNAWILGTNFLSAYYTEFDFENGRVGFATPSIV